MGSLIKKHCATVGIGLGLLSLGMVWSITNTALASIQKDLSASILHLQWMINAFGICVCIPLLGMGKMGELFGKKKIFLVGLFCAIMASFFAGFSYRIEMLIACMGLFGLAGSIILPLSQALLILQFEEKEKPKAIALWSIFSSIAIGIGPLVAGVILDFWGWRWTYWIYIPLLSLAFLFASLFIEQDAPKETPPDHDWLNVGLFAVFIGSLVIAVMQGPSWGWVSGHVVALFVICAVSLFLFILAETHKEESLFRADLFARRSFLLSAIANGCTIGFIWVSFFLIPLYLQNVMHVNALTTGLVLLLVTLPVAFFSILVEKFAQKIGEKILLLFGVSCFAVGFALQVFVTPSFTTIVIGSICFGFGWVLSWSPSISLALSSIPRDLAAIASGMFITVQELLAILFLAIAGVFFRSVEKNELKPHLNYLRNQLADLNSEQFTSTLANPDAAMQMNASPKVLSLLESVFTDGYHAAFSFVLAMCLFSAIVILFFPKKSSPPFQG